jgi:hypothetical protein
LVIEKEVHAKGAKSIAKNAEFLREAKGAKR